MAERRRARIGNKVVHRHRIGALVFRRVSELLYVQGQPKAILHWIDIAGMRTPLYLDLDVRKLRRIRAGLITIFHYSGTTVDPTTAGDPRPPERGRRRTNDQPLAGGRRSTDPPAGRQR